MSGGELSLKITAEEAEVLKALARVEQAQDDITGAAKRMYEGTRQAAGEARAMAREAARITEANQTPLERFNSKLMRTSELYKAGKIDAETYSREVERLKRDYENAEDAIKGVGEAQGKAFGGDAIGEIENYITKTASLAAAVGFAKEAFDEMSEASERAAGSRREAEGGISSLAELAGGDRQRMAELAGEAREIYREGGAKSLDEAGKLAFQLESAGAMGERQFFSRLQGIDDPVEMARAAGVMRSAMGEAEAGSFQAIVSKGLAAAGPVPGVTAAQMLQGAAAAAPNARALEISDEELMAATSIVAQSSGSASQAGTQVRALLQAVTTRGIGEQFKGQGLESMVEAIRGQGMGEADLIKYLGSSEAYAAYSQLRPEAYRERLEVVRRGQRENLAGRTIEAAEAIPEVRLARQERMAAAEEDLARDREALMNMQANQIVAGEKQRLLEASGGSWLGRARAALTGMAAGGFRKLYGDEGFVETFENVNTLRRQTTGQSELMPRAEESFEVQRNLYEATEGRKGIGFVPLPARAPPPPGEQAAAAPVDQAARAPLAEAVAKPQVFGPARPQPGTPKPVPPSDGATAWDAMYGQPDAWDREVGAMRMRQPGGRVGMGFPVEEIEQQRRQFEAASQFAPELIQVGAPAVDVRMEAPADATGEQMVQLMEQFVHESRRHTELIKAQGEKLEQLRRPAGPLTSPDRDR